MLKMTAIFQNMILKIRTRFQGKAINGKNAQHTSSM